MTGELCAGCGAPRFRPSVICLWEHERDEHTREHCVPRKGTHHSTFECRTHAFSEIADTIGWSCEQANIDVSEGLVVYGRGGRAIDCGAYRGDEDEAALGHLCEHSAWCVCE